VCEMDGAELLKGIEQMLQKIPAETGAFPHFSDGVAATYDVNASLYQRIKSFSVDGKPVLKNQKYYVCVNQHYTIKAGDGVTTFFECGTKLKSKFLIREVMIDFLRGKKLSGISGKLTQRRFLPMNVI